MLRRTFLRGVVQAAFASPAVFAGHRAFAKADLSFPELYSKIGVLGLEISPRVKELVGQTVSMQGFMAPPLKAEANFFVLTEIPMAICPFCSSDADWPSNIVVVYMEDKTTFAPPSIPILTTGTLEFGSWTDPETGFVSLLRIRDATFQKA